MDRTRREFCHGICGAVSGLAGSSLFTVPLARREVEREVQELSSDSSTAEKFEPSLDSRIKRNSDRAATIRALNNSAMLGSVTGIAGAKFLAPNLSDQERASIAEQYGNAVDPSLSEIVFKQTLNRRSWFTSMRRGLAIALFAGPLLASEFCNQPIRSYTKKPKSKKALAPQELAEALHRKTNDDGRNSIECGIAAGSIVSIGDHFWGKLATEHYQTLLKVIDESREKLAKMEKFEILGWNEINAVGRPKLTVFLPVKTINEASEPIDITLTIEGQRPIQVAYFPVNNGFDKNWSGPGVYYKIYGQRDTSKRQIEMPTYNFSMKINNTRTITHEPKPRTAQSAA